MQALYFYVISSHVIVIIKTLDFDTTFLIQYTNTKFHLQQPFLFLVECVCYLRFVILHMIAHRYAEILDLPRRKVIVMYGFKLQIMMIKCAFLRGIYPNLLSEVRV